METGNDGLPIIAFESEIAWEEWLESKHASATGVWIKMAKKASGIPSVDWKGAVDVALCFGWIDGQRRSHDDTWFLQRFVPRRKASRWSQVNQENVRRLQDAGRMRPAGLAEVDRAKANGRWDEAYPSQRNMEVPKDLRVELDQDPGAASSFDALKASERFSILLRLHHTKGADTRAKVIREFLDQLTAGK